MKLKTVAEIEGAILPVAVAMNVEIVEIELKNGPMPTLTFYIETEDGVDLDTCEAFHRAIDPVIDELDPTYGAPYTLNISSPGLDRPFKTERDYERNLGEEVEVKLFAPLKGQKLIEGVLANFDANTITLETKTGELKLERSKIAKINKAIQF